MLFISQVVPKGWKGAGGTASIHCSSSKHLSHKHDPNLSGVVKDVLISPHNRYLLKAVRQFPKPAAQLQAGCLPQEPNSHSRAHSGQGPARKPWYKVSKVPMGAYLPCEGRSKGRFPPGHPPALQQLLVPLWATATRLPKPFHLPQVPRSGKLTCWRHAGELLLPTKLEARPSLIPGYNCTALRLPLQTETLLQVIHQGAHKIVQGG